MERSGLARWLLLGLAALLLFTYVPKWLGNGDAPELQPLQPELTEAPASRQPEKLCSLRGPRFEVELTTRGASVKHAYLLRDKYRREGKQIDLSTTTAQELYRQLHFSWRNSAVAGKDAADWQVDHDALDYELVEQPDNSRCDFVYESEKARITKTIRTTERPYELVATATIENRASVPLRHALSIHTAAWRLDTEVAGEMFRVSPYITHVECSTVGGDTVRLLPDDFEPGDFQEPAFSKSSLNPGDWYQVAGTPTFAAVSNAYFAHALVPLKSPKGTPACQLQIEERWDAKRFGGKGADPNSGAMYRARLAYEATTLTPGKSARYEVLTYVGPKERDLLAAAGGGNTGLGELIDLGFFAAIAKILVAFLVKVYQFIPSWGVAIIILTLTARILLFPLAIPSIKSMIKMRELKPEIEALNQKFKDDAQGKGLAQMELWRKHNVNPLKGCLPQLASLPVWFALYTTLQTAVELYNIPFLWFPDLSEPDPYYILPFVIGSTYFLQQKMMPMQMDPAQQKMMLYFMPGMFTVFMLFLPSGLGVYMFTNSVLGIAQQQIVEYHAKRSGTRGNGTSGKKDVTAEGGASLAGAPKAKASKRTSSPRRLKEGQPSLGKGKA